jgi:radical SAM/Cys-rich protein
MHAVLPLLQKTDFPPIARRGLATLQVNLGYVCNQTCQHCHVNAGPNRTESMDAGTVDAVVDALIDRCNLTVLSEPGQEDLAAFLAEHHVEVTASLPCYLEDNVDAQRGKGVYAASVRGLQALNALGYGAGDGTLVLNLVYNPLGPSLPPPQAALEADYKRMLGERFGIRFDRLLTLANMPIQRFGSTLVSKGGFGGYMGLLKGAHRDENLDAVMCRDLVSVDWQGWVYDCDFNQMLGLPMRAGGRARTHVRELAATALAGLPIVVRDHCYGCTAGQGSSCGGALAAA